jgi:hypothetical protein
LQLMMSSSTDSSLQQLELPNITGLTISCTGSSDAALAVLLHHPSVSHDQQLVAMLLQTSTEVQAQVQKWGVGQLQVTLHPSNMQQIQYFTHWLQKYGCLVCGIAADLTRKHSPHCMGSCSSDCSEIRDWAAAAAPFLSAAIQQAAAAAAGVLQLQSFSLAGSTTDAALLLHLSARHLTQLHVEVDVSSSGSIWAVAALAALRELKLTIKSPQGTAAFAIAHNSPTRSQHPATCLHPLQHLRQLTQLQLVNPEPEQLLCLPPLLPQLQQLHITADVCGDPARLLALARWLQQHADVMASLQLVDTGCVAKAADGKAAVQGFVTALRAAAAERPAVHQAVQRDAGAAATSVVAAAASSQSKLKLQSLSMGLALPDSADDLVVPLLRALPASSLTSLRCQLNWGDTAQVRALKKLTALRSCVFTAPCWSVNYLNNAMLRQRRGARALARLSTLQHLTRLQLAEVERAQLQHLQLRQLRVLEVQMFDQLPGRQLNLSQLAAVQQLKVTDATPLLPGDHLPPNLRELVWLRLSPLGQRLFATDRCGFVLKPLLALSCLEKLQLHTQGAAAAAAGLRQLSRLGQLSLSFGYSSMYPARNLLTASVADAWHGLQLRSLKLHNVEVSACFLQRLLSFKGLAWLSLDQVFVSHNHREGKLVLQLAAALKHLTGLQRLALTNTLPECRYILDPDFSDTSDDDDDACGLGALQGPCPYCGVAPHCSHSADDIEGLDASGFKQSPFESMGSSVGVEGLPALLRAIGRLPASTEVLVHWELPEDYHDPASWMDSHCSGYDGAHSAAYQQLSDRLWQVLAPWLVPHCELRKDLLRIST